MEVWRKTGKKVDRDIGSAGGGEGRREGGQVVGKLGSQDVRMSGCQEVRKRGKQEGKGGRCWRDRWWWAPSAVHLN